MAAIQKPGKDVLSKAIEYAQTLRDIDDDHHGLAHVLLYITERNRFLESVAKAADAYIRSGQEPLSYQQLALSLKQFEQYERELEHLE